MSSKVIEQLSSLFEPGNVAVIGASNQMLKWGYIVPANILSGGYKGDFYPINLRDDVILDKPVLHSIKDVPGEVDLAIVTVPAERVNGVVGECIQKGVKTCIVISGGFSETREGAGLEKELTAMVEGSSMRLVGPNTMGIYSAPANLHALMPPVRPCPGKIAFAAQSGNLGTQVMSLGKAYGVGFSRFVCIGNEADLKCADYVEYFADDPETDVILLYIEGLRDARRFVEVVSEAVLKKPVVVMKAGKTAAGAKAARSHSAALAADATIFEGVLRQAGMIEAETTEDMLDIAKAFAAVPAPKGKRVAVLTWGGGWGVVTADALAKYGLELVKFPGDTLKKLDEVLPPYWSHGNPVDLVGTLELSAHFKCLQILADCPDVDSVISLGTMGATSSFQSFVVEGPGAEVMDNIKPRVITSDFIRRMASLDEAYRDEVIRLMGETNKPIIAVSFPTAGSISPVLARQSEIVIYPSPERGAKTLAALYEYQQFLQRKEALV